MGTALLLSGAGFSQSPPAANVPPAAVQPTNPPANPPPAVAPPAAASTADGVDKAQFGEPMELVVRPAIIWSGKADWDDIYGELRQVFEKMRKIAKDNDLVVSGPPMVRFASSDDDMAQYIAMLPVAALPSGLDDKLKPARAGQTLGGKVLRFVHLGAYDTIGQTYDEAANLLDERAIKIDDAFVEEYIRDPETTKEADLATFIYVFPRQ